MDIDQLNAEWTQEEVRQRISASLGKALTDAGLEHTEIKVNSTEMSVVGIADTPEAHEILAAATTSVLKANGVTDITGLKVSTDLAGDKLALNIVYKNGGWIFNSKDADKLGGNSGGGGF